MHQKQEKGSARLQTIISEAGKHYADISALSNWEKNPRVILHDDFLRLKKQIERLGEYKPLIVNQSGIVLGGNMRLRVYQELNWEKVWVSVVEAETEKEMLEYALSDNDAAGTYDQQVLAELILSTPNLTAEDYSLFKVESGKIEDLQAIVDKFAPSTDVTGQSIETPEDTSQEVECPECGHKFTPDA